MRGTEHQAFDLEAQSERHAVSLKRHLKKLNLAGGQIPGRLELGLARPGGLLLPKGQPQTGSAGKKP